MHERLGKARCPESFDMTAEGVAAIVELLPWLLADAAKWVAENDAEDAVRDHASMEALEGLAARLGVELPTGATA